MEKKVVIFLSFCSMAVMCLCITVLLKYPGLHLASLALQERTAEGNGLSVLSLLKDNSQLLQMSEDYAELQEHQLRLELPGSVKKEDITITNNYMSHEISLAIPGIGKTYFYDFPMVGNSDNIEDLRYDVDDRVGIINITTSRIYECVMTKKRNYLYLDFKKPHQVYQYVVAIDAGHGGRAPGANQGDVLEKNLTLEIVKQLKKIFDKDKHKIGVYYTRLDDSDPAFESRVGLANDIKADAFVSVHINSTDSGRMSGIHGTSVLYLVADKSGKSKDLAQSCLNHMLENMGSTSKGLVPGDEIYIIRKSKVPVALCEVGFLTNPEEQRLMQSKEYQIKAAKGIYEGILEQLGVDRKKKQKD